MAGVGSVANLEVQNNAYSVHSRTRALETASPWLVVASHGLGVQTEDVCDRVSDLAVAGDGAQLPG